MGIVNNEPYFVHGTDVAYSTVITAQIREELLKTDFSKPQYRPNRTGYIQKMNEIYKSVTPGCISLQDKSGTYTSYRAGI